MLRAAVGLFFLVLVAGAPAAAQGIERFYGHFEGSGISENADSIYFAVSVRDLDIRIGPAAGGGFSLSWTTITREGGDPNNPKVKKKEANLVFTPTDQPGVYRATEPGDPLRGEPVWWSRIDGNALFTYRMQINLDGTWQVQKYVRTVSGAGMTLVFERLMDGEQVRQVRGRLIKVGN